MRIAILFGPLCLTFRGSFDFSDILNDPRGLTGSEYGFIRIAEELRDAGHTVELITEAAQDTWGGMPVRKKPEGKYDLAVAINEPDLLRTVDAAFRVCMAWLNDFSFCKAGFDKHVDLFCSPSAAHIEQVMTNPAWCAVEKSPQYPEGREQYKPDPAKWCVVHLGCDPHKLQGPAKVPGRVIYCSSPDRGLHNLLEQWPHIKRAAPHAHLRIFYRLQPWIDGFRNTPYFPPIENLRARALYVEEALRRMSDPKWAIEVVGSVSRARIEREMAEAEVTGYPCDPSNDFTEGFSCSTLEACAARACPVITDADALGSLYGEAVPAVRRANWMGITWQEAWRRNVIECLTDPVKRKNINDRAEALARTMTWKATAEKLLAAAKERL